MTPPDIVPDLETCQALAAALEAAGLPAMKTLLVWAFADDEEEDWMWWQDREAWGQWVPAPTVGEVGAYVRKHFKHDLQRAYAFGVWDQLSWRLGVGFILWESLVRATAQDAARALTRLCTTNLTR